MYFCRSIADLLISNNFSNFSSKFYDIFLRNAYFTSYRSVVVYTTVNRFFTDFFA